jgi:hypothetical protein
MTASETPALGLMNPVSSDEFSTSDFSNTFQILDGNPGTLPVPNQASLPTGWGPNQHGRKVLQTDLGVEYYWNQPSGSSSGAWKRIPNGGWLGGTLNPNQVSASSNQAGGVNLISLPLLIPGGRPVQVVITFLWGYNANNGQIGLTYYENGVPLLTSYYPGRPTGSTPFPPSSGSFVYTRGVAPTTQKTVTFGVNLINNNTLGSGTSVIAVTTLDVYES